MRRFLVAALAAWVAILAPCAVYAENSIAFWGNYYLEQRTRVISPSVALRAELPADTNIQLSYLIDNITSASGTFQAEESDEPFEEFRQELRAQVDTEVFGFLRPGVLARYSFEPDYTSVTYGAYVLANLFDDNTVLEGSVQRQNDAIMARGTNFEDTLDTWRASFSITQVVLPRMVVGASVEGQVLDGYTENPYRMENHPRDRVRWAFGGWAAYRFVESQTSIRLGYRYYEDDWKIVGHTVDLQLFQKLSSNVEIIPRLRFHTQTGADFRDQIERDGITYETNDPKLRALGTTGLGLRLVVGLTFLEGSALHPFRTASIQPSYMFYAQRNELELNPIRVISPEDGDQTLLGDAHVAQLGLCWPY